MTTSDLQQLYQQIILDHAKARHGSSAEPLAPLADTAAVGPGGLRLAESHQVNTTCGDQVTVRVAVGVGVGATAQEDDGAQEADGVGEPAVVARIEDLVWCGDGCSISMASASVLSDTVRGTLTRDARAQLDAFREMLRSRGTIEPNEESMGDAVAFAGVSRYPARVKCAMLPWVAFEAALLEVESRP